MFQSERLSINLGDFLKIIFIKQIRYMKFVHIKTFIFQSKFEKFGIFQQFCNKFFV